MPGVVESTGIAVTGPKGARGTEPAITVRMEPLPNGGTRVHDYSQLHLPLPGWISKIMARAIMLYHFKYDQALRNAAQLAGEEYQRSSPVDTRSTPQSGSVDQRSTTAPPALGRGSVDKCSTPQSGSVDKRSSPVYKLLNI